MEQFEEGNIKNKTQRQKRKTIIQRQLLFSQITMKYGP